MFGSIAIENLIAKYHARFKPNPDGDGYLFSGDDYSEGVACSAQQYHDYADEFESFVSKRQSFMWLWLLIILVVFATGMGVLIYFYGIESFKHIEDMIPTIGAVAMVLPLPFIFKRGWQLFQKPVTELGVSDNPVKRRQSSSDIMDKRLKGMSFGLILAGIIFPAAGLYFSLTDKDYGPPYFPYFFGIILILFLVGAVFKFKAHQKDRKTLQEQNQQAQKQQQNNSEYRVQLTTAGTSDPKNEDELKNKYHSLIDNIAYGGNKDKFHEIINTSLIPKRGDEDYVTGLGSGRSTKYISYFFRVLREFENISPHFIFVMDWKAGVEDLKWHIEHALKDTPYQPKLPANETYPSDASILHGLNFADPSAGTSLVFTDYILALREVDLQITFVESYSDEYILFLEPMDTSSLSGTGLTTSFRLNRHMV